jgi:hypothetical protein
MFSDLLLYTHLEEEHISTMPDPLVLSVITCIAAFYRTHNIELTSTDLSRPLNPSRVHFWLLRQNHLLQGI